MARQLNLELVKQKFGTLKTTEVGKCAVCGIKANRGGHLCANHSRSYRSWRGNVEERLARAKLEELFGTRHVIYKGHVVSTVLPKVTPEKVKALTAFHAAMPKKPATQRDFIGSVLKAVRAVK